MANDTNGGTMKQGRGNSSAGSQKREPISHAVNVGTVSQIGLACGGSSKPLYEGRGYEAPKAGSTTYKSGSQGKR